MQDKLNELVKNGFWHIKLEKESFGRYRWLRMSFGICSAPNIFQRKMHELIEEIPGIEVIADDFLVVGCGDTIEEATIDHDRKLRSFLRKCTKEKIHLNIEKIKLREKKVTYIWHILSAEGVTPGEYKLKAIIQMLTPQDVIGIKRLLGMIQYIDTFIKNLSTRTENMRRLTRKDVLRKMDRKRRI